MDIKLTSQSTIQSIGTIVALLASFHVSAADIAREVQNSGDGKGWYAELGLTFSTTTEPLVGLNDLDNLDSDGQTYSLDVSLEGRFEYKRFFLETIDNSFSNLTLGINVHSSEKSNHDIILTSLFGEIERRELNGFETITDRKADLNLGLRSSYYFGNNIVQLELLGDVLNSHNGVTGTLQIGRHAQVRNWNLHGLVGLRVFSGDVVDHLFGISAEEATAELPAYEAEYGVVPSIALGATIPLNEKWLFRANASYLHLSNSVTNSPLAQGDSIHSVGIGVHYVLNGS